MKQLKVAAGGGAGVASFISENAKRLKGKTQARICIVTPDLLGLVKNGGIGTACHHTAVQLAKSGLDVTVLFTVPPEYVDPDDVAKSKEYYCNQQVKLVVLADEFADDYPTPVFPVDSAIRLSYYSYQWLKVRKYDVVLFADWHTTGYYCMLAKKQGLAFSSTCLAVQVHSPSVWGQYYNKAFSASAQELRMFHMEKETIRHADFVTCPTRYLLDWVKKHGFSLPQSTYFQPYLFCWDKVIQKKTLLSEEIKQLVYFGRLEERKGIHIFCDAIGRLASQTDMMRRSMQITFLGKPGHIGSVDSLQYIAKKKSAWPWEVEIISDLGSNEALAYLKVPGRVAVICPTADNSPLTVHECMHNSIPFISTNVGGIPEMLTNSGLGRGSPLFEANFLSLAAKLQEILADGVSTVLPAKDAEENAGEWRDSFNILADIARDTSIDNMKRTSALKAVNSPKVSVCVPTFNRPDMLGQALESLRRQTFEDFEVVLVDDGSTKPEAVAYLKELEAEFSARGWQLLRQENQYPGAARNNAARHAKGEYLLFMDDDNFAQPNELERFYAAITHGKADVLVCLAAIFSGNSAPNADTPVTGRYMPLGNAINLAFFENALGDTNFMIKRKTFLDVGGFTTDYGVGYEDFEFLCKMVIEGFDVQVVPEVLFWYRKAGESESVNNSTLTHNNMYRVLRPMFESQSGCRFGDALLYLFAHSLSQISAHARLPSSDCSQMVASTMLAQLKQFGVKTFAVYGAGMHTVKIASVLQQAPIKLICIIDDSPKRQGIKMLQVPVVSMEEAKQLRPDVIVISSDTAEDVLCKKAIESTKGTGIQVFKIYSQGG